MTEPSAYELNAWRNIQQFKGRPLSQAMRNVGEQVANGAAKVGERATEYLESQPRAQAVVVRGQEFAAKGTQAMSAAARNVAKAIPDGVSVWGGSAPVQALASRCVGQVSLLYGYDPEDPAEKLFVMSVLNAGTAMSTGAKYAAMADISKLTQALYRGKSWAVLLDQSLLAQVSKKFTEKFIGRLTKQGLGKVVPAAGIALGGAFNWTTLESVVDVADTAYRRRFLLEKYPHLAEEASEPVRLHAQEGVLDGDIVDDEFSVLEEIVEVGGPDLR